jgi:hypothetical protein
VDKKHTGPPKPEDFFTIHEAMPLPDSQDCLSSQTRDYSSYDIKTMIVDLG